MKTFIALISLFFSLLFISCGLVTGLVEKGGNLLEGQPFKYKTNTRWRPLNDTSLDLKNITWKDGKEELVFSTSAIPFITFYGTPPQSDGIFYITRAHFLAGNYGGWNEFDIQASGTGRIRPQGEDSIAFTVFDGIELLTIIDGRIRRENTRLAESRALEELNNRNERVTAISDWMKVYAAENNAPDFTNDKEFEKYWRLILFPKKSAPAVTLPEDLQALRESGALDADWNEAVLWIYLYYDWAKLVQNLSKEVVLIK
jgi:hypothetical protein